MLPVFLIIFVHVLPLVKCCASWNKIQNGDVFCSDQNQLGVRFQDGTSVTCGREYPASTIPSGEMKVTYEQATEDKRYLMIMVDPDAPSSDAPACKYYLHWLVNGIQGYDVADGLIKGHTITEYMAPGPPAGSGPHRYQLILLDAPTSHIITEPDDRCAFNVQDLITDNDLCDSQVATFQFSAQAA